MDNPFVYAKPVAPESMIGREAESRRTLELLHGGHNCRLSAPRRYGKTSLVHKVLAAAEFDGTPTVYVNFFGILSLDDAVARLERGYRNLRGPLAQWARGKLDSMSLSITTPIGQIAAGVSTHGVERRLYDLLDLPVQLFARTGVRAYVAFDEFQEILSPKPALDGALRSVIEGHGEQAAYLFAGSHPGMMRGLFDDRERPFYGQARSITLAPLDPEDVAADVGGVFHSTGRDLGDALGPLLAITRGHPQRTMMLAHFLWERTPRGTAADEATFQTALEDVMLELAEPFARAWQAFEDGERRTLVAVAASDGHPTRRVGLTAAVVARSTVIAALRRLADAGQVTEDEHGWQIIDPLFALWVARGRLDAV